jgi:hypothetical protein
MDLTLHLSPEEEAQLAEAAAQEGLDPAALAHRFVSQQLLSNPSGIKRSAKINGNALDPSDRAMPNLQESSWEDAIQTRLRRWQEQDRTPLRPSISAHELFAQWAQEDARMTEEEREAEDRFWEEFLKGLNETRHSLGMRTL